MEEKDRNEQNEKENSTEEKGTKGGVSITFGKDAHVGKVVGRDYTEINLGGRGQEDQSDKVDSTPNPENAPYVFISYRRSDSADIVGRIYDRLVDDLGAEKVFKDVNKIPLGEDFRKHLNRALSKCDYLLAVIGPTWVTVTDATGQPRLDSPEDYVRLEVESALERGIPIVPLLVMGANFPTEKDLPESLHPLIFRNGIPVRPDPDFHNDLDRLVADLIDRKK